MTINQKLNTVKNRTIKTSRKQNSLSPYEQTKLIFNIIT
jgi:hypothetical protein